MVTMGRFQESKEERGVSTLLGVGAAVRLARGPVR